MATIQDVLSAETLTGLLEQLRFDQNQFVFTNLIPENRIDGDTAEWVKEKRNAKIDQEMVGRDGAAQVVRHAEYARRTFSIPYTFKVMPLPGDTFFNLKNPDTGNFDNGVFMIGRQIRLLEELYGQYLDEYLAVQALLDSVPVKIDGVTYTITFGLPATHKNSTAQGWSTSTTDILASVRTAKRTITQDSGRRAARAFLNDATADYVRKNDLVTKMYASTTEGARMIAEGDLPNIAQLNWTVHEGRYTTSDGAALDTPFIADNYVLFTAEFPNAAMDWIEFQSGSFAIPNDAGTGFQTARGRASWARVSDSPTGLNVYLKRCRFPVVRGPESVFWYTNVA